MRTAARARMCLFAGVLDDFVVFDIMSYAIWPPNSQPKLVRYGRRYLVARQAGGGSATRSSGLIIGIGDDSPRLKPGASRFICRASSPMHP